MASKNIKCSLKVLDGGTAAIVLPSPTDISFGKERVCKEQRAMDGTMVIDMIAVKNSYELMWDVMNGSVMKKLRAMLESSGNTFFEIAMTLKTKDLTDHVSGSGDEGVDTQAFEEKKSYYLHKYPVFVPKPDENRDFRLPFSGFRRTGLLIFRQGVARVSENSYFCNGILSINIKL